MQEKDVLLNENVLVWMGDFKNGWVMSIENLSHDIGPSPHTLWENKGFLSYISPLFQSESWCEAFHNYEN